MTEKRKKATALRYNQETDIAPKVTAIGKGMVAEDIIGRAMESDVPIIEDASLVELLTGLNINESVPPELYQAVAEVFSFIYYADKQMNIKESS